MTWLGRLLRRRRLEIELDAELRDHIERQVAEYMRQGLSEQEARRRTGVAFGGIEQMKEHCRDARGTRWLHDAVQDGRYAARLLRRGPLFSAVVIGSLALGIGANTAIFSLLDSLLLRSLPVRAPERLAVLTGGDWTNPIWEQIRQRQGQLFDGALAWADERFDLASGGEVEPVDAMLVSGEFFDVLGVPALLGRTIAASDDRRGGGPDGQVAVISHRFWQQRFDGATDAIGRTLTLNRVPFTIIGVAPSSFAGPTVGRAFDVAVPIGIVDLLRGGGPESQLDGRSTWWLQVMVRMKPGQTIEQATQALNGVRRQIRDATMPANWPGDARLQYLRDSLTLAPAANGFSGLRTRYQRPLQVLMGVVVLVLLITCANVANLLLARANARRHEMSARLALGASRLRLARQLLTESLLLAVLGALLGLALAQWAGPLLVHQLSTPERVVSLDMSLSWRVLIFNAIVASATALIFGIAPAFRATRVAPHEVLAEHGRGHTGDRRRSLSGALVVAQIALSLVLVVGAGLFVRTFSTLARLDLGFDVDRVLLVNVDTSAVKDPSERRAMYDRAQEAAMAVPGVVHAGLSLIPPMSGMGWNDEFDFPGRALASKRDRVVWVNAVTPGFFATYGTPLRAGRDFNGGDRGGAGNVVIVNEAFVRKYFTDRNPIGEAVHRAGFPGHPAVDATIVGVVGNAAYRSLREPLAPIVYMPLAQLPEAEQMAGLAVRVAAGSPLGVRRSLGAALQRVDPRLTLTFRPLSEQVDAALAQERLIAMLSGFFGGLALLLAAIGLYGVTSYTVARRRNEIGIRMALGADPRHVIRLIVGRAALLVCLGVAIGGALSLWASRFVATMLFGLEPRDPATFAGAAVVLAVVGALAAWIPARRGSRIDPACVLREG